MLEFLSVLGLIVLYKYPEAWNTAGGEKDKIGALILQAHHEEAGGFGKDINAEKKRRRQERERSNMRWIDCMKETIGLSLKELNRAAVARILWTSLIRLSGVGGDSQVHNTQYCTVCKWHILFIDSSIHAPLGCFRLLALVNSITMKVDVKIFHQDPNVIQPYTQKWHGWTKW